jgi:hypothetical protein
MRTKDPDAGKNGVPEDKMLLSKNTIGHAAASHAILRVDIDNGVVVSQVRNKAGKDYGKYFIEGFEACRSEWSLICATHNLLKVWRSGKVCWN